jgi:hypothetical protein
MMKKMTQIKEFKKEMKALLEKYNADISVQYNSYNDVYGVYDEHMTASLELLGKDGKKVDYEIECWGTWPSELP